MRSRQQTSMYKKGKRSGSDSDHAPSTLRIIAGKFRSRKITFFEEDGLRPTHNRIRETLFNWLQPVIENSMCCDVFAGSGALGFEALSRGAKHVTFIDISNNVINTLKQNANQLHIENADFCVGDFLKENSIKIDKKFDIVFCDPPFQKNLLIAACEKLECDHLLNENAMIYCEFEKDSVDIKAFPKNWEVKKKQSTKTIEFILFLRKKCNVAIV